MAKSRQAIRRAFFGLLAAQIVPSVYAGRLQEWELRSDYTAY